MNSPKLHSPKPLPPDRYFNRELSWLEFNQRVLEQASDENQPLLERLKFLAITGSNLDEFFMVRVGGLKMQAEQNPTATDPAGMTVFEQLKAVSNRCHRLQNDQYAILLDQLEPAMQAIGIQRIDLRASSDRHGEAADRFFASDVLPVLSPQTISPDQPFPLLPGLQVHLCVRLKPLAVNQPTSEPPGDGGEGSGVATNGAGQGSGAAAAGSSRAGELAPPPEGANATVASDAAAVSGGDAPEWDYAVIPLGRVLSRIVSLPADSGYCFALLEDVVIDGIEQFFPGRQVVECATFRLTRNADVELREDSAADLMVGMGEVLESRKASDAIRLELDDRAGEEMTDFLRSRLELGGDDVFRARGPLDLAYLFQLSSLEGFDSYRDPSWPSQSNPMIDPRESMFDTIARGDLLMVHPYERFDPVVRLIEEAAADPDVLAIKQVLYRISRKSPIVAALMRAAERGKYVTAVVELKARFDEARNIEWAREMEQAGVQVIYGVKGFKTHAKVCVIVRREAQGIVRYLHFGTGNYNEVTARLYSDVSLLSCDDELGADASAFFNAVTGASQQQQFTHLAAAPLTLRKRLLAMIEAEAGRCREGQRGRIVAKLNALVDSRVIDALYRASQAGVRIQLNIRGVCCLRPGVPGLSDNIEVRSIVDRYLEHARIMYFYQGGEEAMFISSADWMPRNLDRRIELLIPVLDPTCRKKLWRTLDAYFHDNLVTWRLGADGQYRRLKPDGDQHGFRAQRKLYERAVQDAGTAQTARQTMFEPHQPGGEKLETGSR
ncbi:polyphosphate kinase 1 [Candidatus Laterigemmans baculatus]|uniref:polyphosphate kinase 1 n=1 Tax=Candidatus Laterigemmans baculatus TaxID=2770505 RepID=UPI0013DA5681|nr:polyphosphate kinase 1 [Candidatus Laterigemmans baculatus]